MIKNEADRRAKARRCGKLAGKHALSAEPPYNFRTQIEREEFAAGHQEGVQEAQREHDEGIAKAEAEEEARRNAPPPVLDDAIEKRWLLVDECLPRVVWIAIGKLATNGGSYNDSHGNWGRKLLYGSENAHDGVIFCMTEKRAQFAAELAVAIMAALKDAKQKGRDDGHNLLERLANGEVTVDEADAG